MSYPPSISQADIVQFFERLTTLKAEDARQFMEQFTAFAPGFQAALMATKLTNQCTAPGFDADIALSKLRSAPHLEELHSAFLAFLFNPEASHAQGHLFLETFFDTLKVKNPHIQLPSPPLDRGIWRIWREYGTDEGYPDIVLWNPTLNAYYIIENKIKAREQKDQIFRYATNMERYTLENPNHELFFLTIDGHPSRTAHGSEHIPISYRTEVRQWLEKALPAVQAEPVREAVRQYLALIKTF